MLSTVVNGGESEILKRRLQVEVFIDVPVLTAMLVLPVVWRRRITEYALVQIHVLNDEIV